MTPNTNTDKKPSYSSFYYKRSEAQQNKKYKQELIKNFPEVNIIETDNSYHYELKIPGYIEEDFNFYILGEQLVVTTERRKFKKTLENTASRHSYCYPSALFKRKFTLPEDIIRNKIDVEYRNEVLSFDLFKSED